jgi:hypothetical protein
MSTWLKLAAIALLCAIIAVLLVRGASAQTTNSEAASAADQFCDYCKDFTDEATAADAPRSAYRPGSGYAPEPQKDAATDVRQSVEQARVRPHSKSPRSEM